MWNLKTTIKQPKCIDNNEEEIGGCQRQGSLGVGEGSQERQISRSFILLKPWKVDINHFCFTEEKTKT